MNRDGISESIVDELREVGIDLSKFPENKRKAVCELYGYRFDDVNNGIENKNNKSNAYVPKLRKTNTKQSAYVDALVLSLVTGLFGGIFLTIVSFAIK